MVRGIVGTWGLWLHGLRGWLKSSVVGGYFFIAVFFLVNVFTLPNSGL